MSDQRGVWRDALACGARLPQPRVAAQDHAREVQVLRPSTTLVLLLVIALLTGGCADTVVGIGSLVASGIGIIQRWEDRQTQKDQNTKIEALTKEIKANREKPAPAYLCLHGVAPTGPATVCREMSGHQ